MKTEQKISNLLKEAIQRITELSVLDGEGVDVHEVDGQTIIEVHTAAILVRLADTLNKENHLYFELKEVFRNPIATRMARDLCKEWFYKTVQEKRGENMAPIKESANLQEAIEGIAKERLH